MIRSMTGYGKGECVLSDHSKVTVEIKSLNGKNAEISVKGGIIPKDKELEIRKLLSKELVRGSIDFTVQQQMQSEGAQKQINPEVFASYYKQLKKIQKSLAPKSSAGAKNAVAGNWEEAVFFSSILRIPDVIENKHNEVSEQDWKKIDKAIGQAIKKINSYRIAEGQALCKDITKRINNILKYLQQVKKEDVKRAPAIKERLRMKIGETGLQVDNNRLEQEIVFYIEKLDINEEKVRLAQHCSYFLQTLETDPFAGKKLGFIVQEIGREINTMGSKANDARIQTLVVKMKDELEKIREQSLNIL